MGTRNKMCVSRPCCWTDCRCETLSSVTVTLGGIANGTNCTACTALNGAYVLTGDPCGQNDLFSASVCPPGSQSFQLYCGAEESQWRVILYYSSGGLTYAMATWTWTDGTSSYNCTTQRTLTLQSYNNNVWPKCDMSAATCIVTPAA